jgi:hypothetical protein
MNQPQSGNSPIGHGVVLVEKGTILPEPIRLETDSTGSGWARVASDGNVHELEQKIDAAGWTFSYLAGAIRASAFGFDRQGRIHGALRRLFRTAKRQNCNCLEIDDIEMHSFLGVPYVSVSAHSRQISVSKA